MLQAVYHMFLFCILLCLRGWEMPAEVARTFSLRLRLTDAIAGKLMGGTPRGRSWSELEHTA